MIPRQMALVLPLVLSIVSSGIWAQEPVEPAVPVPAPSDPVTPEVATTDTTELTRTHAVSVVDEIRRMLVISRPDSVERQANRRYRVGIGASFNFLDGFKATDIYGDVSIRIPQFTAGSPWGVDAGLYNGRATIEPSVNNISWSVAFPRTPHADSTHVVTQSLVRTEKAYVDNLTLYVGPSVHAWSSLFLAGHLEVGKRENVQIVTFEVTDVDSVVLPTNEVRVSPTHRLREDGETYTLRTPGYATFVGVGTLLNHDDADYNIWHKLLIGLEMMGSERTWSYVAQFRITDFDHGFKLGGEIRGSLDFDAPSIAVFLARDVSISKLADFLVGGNGGSSPE